MNASTAYVFTRDQLQTALAQYIARNIEQGSQFITDPHADYERLSGTIFDVLDSPEAKKLRVQKSMQGGAA